MSSKLLLPSFNGATTPVRRSATFRRYAGSIAALALAITAVASPAAFAQGAKHTPAADENGQKTAAQNNDLGNAYYHYMLAHEYEEMAATYGRPEYATRAIEEYKMALDNDPNSTFLNHGLAELYYRTGHIKDAIDAAQALIQKDPNDLDAHKLLASVYLRSLSDGTQTGPQEDMLKLAIAEYEKIVQLEPKSIADRVLLGQLYSFAHESKKAEEQFSAAQKIDPGSEESALNLARLYMSQSDSAHAIKVLSSLPPNNQTAKTEYMLGVNYDQQKDTTNAIAAYQKSLDLEPGNLDVKRALAQDLFNDNQLSEAESAYEDIAENDPSDAEALLRLSEIERRQGKYDASLATLEKAKALVPHSLEIQFNEGLLYDALGRFDEAVQVFEKLVAGSEHANGQYSDADKNNLSVFLDRLAIVYREQNKTDEAIAAYKKMETLGGDYELHAYESEVDAYRDAHDYKKATEVAQDAVGKHPKDVGLQLLLAEQLTDSGQAEQGIALAKSQLTGKASDLEVYRALATIYTRQRMWKDAADALKHVDKLSKSNDDVLYAEFLQGTLLDREGKTDQAEAEFRKALALDPNNSLTLNYLGYMLADHDQKLEEALAMIKKAVKLDPQNYAYLDSLGWAYFKLGDYAQAEANLRQAVERNSTDPTVHDHLGQLYEKTGRLKQAAAQWEVSLKEFAVTVPADTEPGSMAQVQKMLDNARMRLAKEAANPQPIKN
ncbi:MAG TPA: tetratricopeptide repeat protein [Acidobacteriaceae bacterium]|nr:tetratricopeptide repeat protein [Acidobacteriaceae bacterium]